MRILNIMPSYYPAVKYGGPIQSVHLLNKALVKKGVDVEVLSTSEKSGKEYNINNWANIDGVKVKFFRYYGYEGYRFSPGPLLEILREIKNYDLVHMTALWTFPLFIGSMLSAIYKKPNLISPRGSLYKETMEIKSSRKKRLYYNLLLRPCIMRTTALHFTTEDEQTNVMSYLNLKNRSFVVPNGLDLLEFQKLPEKGTFKDKHPPLSGKRYILFLGRINLKKGLDILVQAFRILADEYEDLSLVITGPDNEGYGEKVRQWLNDCGLIGRTVFTGLLTGDEKVQAIVDAELFVLPSYSENFGMSVVEAMACGTPVVISNKVGIYNEIDKNNSGLVVETDPISVYKGVKDLLSNENLKKEMAENGRKLVEKYYNIDHVADRMIEYYKKIIEIGSNENFINKTTHNIL